MWTKGKAQEIRKKRDGSFEAETLNNHRISYPSLSSSIYRQQDPLVIEKWEEKVKSLWNGLSGYRRGGGEPPS
jgi:hypothetical protein